jgi:5-methylcytosine-specific restriction endonuclease McrA
MTRIKRGTDGPDGRVFWQYKGEIEVWLAPEAYLVRKERSKELLRAWCRKHPEIVSERNRVQREKSDKTKLAEASKKWRALNPEKCRELKNKWRAENYSEFRAKANEYQRNNRCRTYAAKAIRRKIVRKLTSGNRQVIQSFYEIARRITKCTGIRFEVDHILPVCLGGHHNEHNLQILTMKMNRKKGGKA